MAKKDIIQQYVDGDIKIPWWVTLKVEFWMVKGFLIHHLRRLWQNKLTKS